MHARYLRTNHPGFYKDTLTGAVINMDTSSKTLYEMKISEKQKLEDLQDQVDRLEKLVKALLEAK